MKSHFDSEYGHDAVLEQFLCTGIRSVVVINITCYADDFKRALSTCVADGESS